MRWPWQKREAQRDDASSAAGDAPSGAHAPVAVLSPPRPRPREWASLPPLVPVAAPRLATIAEVRPAAALATATDLVHRFEPKSRTSDAPAGSWLDAAHVVPGFGGPSEAMIDYTPVELPPMPVRRAPVVQVVVAPEPVEAPPAPELVAPPAPAPERPVARVPEPEPAVIAPEPEPELPEATAPARVLKRNLGQSRRLGLGAPISREPGSEPEPPEPEVEVIPDDIRSGIRSAYGVDIGDVPVRRDRAAADEARSFDAAALARGGDEVILPADLGATDQSTAKGMLAHELTHIAQQRRHGPGLPSESSPEGLILEAEARAAEQHFRGDAGAPRLVAPGTAGPNQLFTTGLADIVDGGELVFAPPPRPVSGMQRIPLQATTPPYRWQQDVLYVEQYEPAPGAEPLPVAEVDEAAEQLERDNLDDLVQYRQSVRQQYVADEQETASVLRYGETPTIPDTGGLSAEQVASVERKAALEQELRHRREAVEIQNQAVDEVDDALPLRDSGADPGAVHASPTDEPELVRLQTEIASIDSTYPDLVHPVADGGSLSTPTFRVRDLAREAFPGFRTMSGAYGMPGSSSVPGTLPSGVSGRMSSGPSPLTQELGPSSAESSPQAMSWEGGRYSASAGEQTAFMDWLADGEPSFDEAANEDGRQRELAGWPRTRAERNALLRAYIAEMVGEVRREAQGRGRRVPTEYQATTQITRSEWQSIAEAVEQQVPLEFLTDEQYSLFGDPENAHLRELVALAPSSRDEEETAGPAGAPTPGTEIEPAGYYETSAFYEPGESDGPGPYSPAPPAAQEEEDEGGVTLGDGIGGLLGAAAMGIASLFDDDDEEEREDPELSPAFLARLTAELYPRFRSRLRTELLVDRERAGLLTDFR